VQSLDLYRTVCELAGLTPPSHVLGTSLVPLLRDPRAAWEQPAYSIWSEDGTTIHGTAIRTEQFRYAEYKKPSPNSKPSEYSMLFDVHADPMELTNLADDPKHEATRTELSKLVNAYSYPG
jgi:arylsulfatase A-like enzyme